MLALYFIYFLFLFLLFYFISFLRIPYVSIVFLLVLPITLAPKTPPMSLSDSFILITSSLITTVYKFSAKSKINRIGWWIKWLNINKSREESTWKRNSLWLIPMYEFYVWKRGKCYTIRQKMLQYWNILIVYNVELIEIKHDETYLVTTLSEGELGGTDWCKDRSPEESSTIWWYFPDEPVLGPQPCTSNYYKIIKAQLKMRRGLESMANKLLRNL